MLDYIKLVIQVEKGISILRHEEYTHGLKFELVDFFCSDDTYKSLMVAYNEVNLYVCNRKLSLPSVKNNTPIISLAQQVREGIVIYKTIEEYQANKLEFLDKNSTDNFFKEYEQELAYKIFNCYTTNFRVTNIHISWYPSTTVIIHYSFKGRNLNPLIWNIGQVTAIEDFKIVTYGNEFKRFIEKLSSILGKVIICNS